MSDSHKPYIIIFKDSAPQPEIDNAIKDVESKGGKIKHKYDSSIMRGFAASMPEEHGKSLTTQSERGKHPHIEYVEPDGEVSTK